MISRFVGQLEDVTIIKNDKRVVIKQDSQKPTDRAEAEPEGEGR